MPEYNKYISVAIREHDIPIIMVFPPIINHVDMASAMKRLRYPVVRSAGFVDEFMQCYGESQGLRLKSKDGDTELLHRQLNLSDKQINWEGRK
jgi:hypothetical protein